MTILVTSGGGFVMSNLVKRWLSDHPCERAMVVDTTPLDANLERFFEPVAARLDWQVGDVLDRGLWQRLSSNVDIDYLVHGAAATSILRHVHTEGPGKPGLAGARHDIAINIDGALNVLEFAASLPNLERMVHGQLGLGVWRTGSLGPTPARARIRRARGALWGLQVCRRSVLQVLGR